MMTKIRTRMINATAKNDCDDQTDGGRTFLPKTGIVAAIQKHIAEPKTFAMKIVNKKIINLDKVRCKPVIE
jgi:hypothetical protein